MGHGQRALAALGVIDAAFWAGRRVLVTGHTGFKGAWLSLWLAQLGAEVHGLSDAVPTEPSLFALAGIAGDLARDDRLDIREQEATAEAVATCGADVVLHLAAQPIVRAGLTDPVGTWAANVMGTAHVLEGVRRAATPPRAVVVVTSDKCYENHGPGRPYVEADPLGGHDPYSASKGAAELVTAAWRRSYFPADGPTQVASARAGNVIGGGDWGLDRLVPDLARAAAAGTSLQVRNPASTRPWQHVLNPLSGYLVLAQRLAEDPAAATGWNFGPDPAEALPVRDVVERLARRWPGVAWEHDGSPHPPEAGFLALSSDKAREELGWRPGWGLEEGLDRTAAWYQAVLSDPAAARQRTLDDLAAFPA